MSTPGQCFITGPHTSSTTNRESGRSSVCPVSVPLELTSRFSLLKVKGDIEACNGCQACVKMCPMDVRIPEYVENGERVLSTECSLCQTCITVYAKDALKLSFGLDLGGKDLLRERPIVEAHHEKLSI